jgi:hypothetical protein
MVAALRKENQMDYWKMEQRAKEQRAQIRQDVAAMRLQKTALRATPPQPGWFAKNMLALGNWMISSGERLRKRYRVAPTPRQRIDRRTSTG